MKQTLLAGAIMLLAAHATAFAQTLGGAAALDVNNWTTNNDPYVAGSAAGFTPSWENELVNTADANLVNNNFDVVFHTLQNYTIGHIFLYNETLDLSTLPPGGIQQLSWDVDLQATSQANWIPVIAVTDGGMTNFYRSNNTGNSWRGSGEHTFVTGAADNNFWVELFDGPVGGINDTRVAGVNPDLQAASGIVQFGFVQWGASTGGMIDPATMITTSIDKFEVTINETKEITDEKNSGAFPHKFNGNEIYDGISFINDWDLPTSADTAVIPSLDETERILTVARDLDSGAPNGWIQQDNDISAWETGVGAGGSFTAEVRVKVAPDADNGFVLWAANGFHRGIIQVNTNSVQPFGLGVIDTNDNTDDFHTFRMAYDADFDLYFFWRDGVLLTEGGIARQATTGNNRLIVGDCCSSLPMTSIEIDYVRYDTTGAFAPGPEGPPLEITEISYDEDTHLVTLTWRSTPGTFYAIEGTLDMQSWPIDIDDGTEGAPDADTTTVSFTAEFEPPVAGSHPSRAFYRVRLAE